MRVTRILMRTMKHPTRRLWLACLLATISSAPAAEIQFGGHAWGVRSGRGGPGPNTWDARNVWLDAATNLHLKIHNSDGQWSCAEVTMRGRLGFGRYDFQLRGPIDRLDDNVVLGLFNYPTGDVGPDTTHEIDIEFARWGEAKNPIGNYTVWPVEPALKRESRTFPVRLAGDVSTHRFTWGRERVIFESWRGERRSDGDPICRWIYAPAEPARYLSRQPMPVHLNLWLFQGRPPKDGREVEVVIQGFGFQPE